jgi:hypothetical protein
LFVWMPLDAPEPLCKGLGVAMLAPRADFGATANRVPGGVGPFDMRIQRHAGSQNVVWSVLYFKT